MISVLKKQRDLYQKKNKKVTSNPLTPQEQQRLDELEADYENLDLLEVTEYQQLMKKIYPDEEALQNVTSVHVDSNDDEELRMWVQNDEGLYNWYKSEYPNDSEDDEEIDDFINDNREEIASFINKDMNKTRDNNY